MRPLLLAAGYVNMDITAELPSMPASGERVTARRIYRSPGGMTANMACAASRLGMEVCFFGRVGGDRDGEQAVSELEGFGVNTDGIRVTENATTTSLILLGPGGERTIVSEPMEFDYGPLRTALGDSESRGRSVHVDGYRLPEAVPMLRAARERGFATSADVDGMEPREVRELIPEIAPYLTVVFINRGISEEVSEAPDETAEKFIAGGTRVVAVTLGSRGALVADGDVVWTLPVPEIRVTDTTGAGDTFAGAFLAEWMEGGDVERAGRFAVAASAISVEAAGARGNLPERQEVERRMRSDGRGAGERAERRGA